MIEMRDLRLAGGLLKLGDSLARDRNHIENRLVTPSREYLYLAVEMARYDSVDVTISQDQLPEGSDLQLQWAGTIKTPSGTLQLDEIGPEMSHRRMWSRSCGPISRVEVHADTSRHSRRVHLVIDAHPDTEQDPEAFPVPAPALVTVRPVLLDTTHPFAWAGLEVMDDTADDVAIADGQPFTISSQCLRIAVRHQDDTSDEVEWPATVRLRVLRGPADSTPTYECVLPVPSRQLTVGDANHTDTVTTDAEQVLVQVQTQPAEDPDDVLIWIS